MPTVVSGMTTSREGVFTVIDVDLIPPLPTATDGIPCVRLKQNVLLECKPKLSILLGSRIFPGEPRVLRIISAGSGAPH